MITALKILIITIIAWFITQLVKTIIYFVKEKRFQLKYLIAYGGMPSSHSASVSALTTSIFLFDGLTTTFVISLIFSIIVMRDAVIVRGTLQNMARQKKGIGHTPLQVITGISIGIVTAIIAYFI